ncbi:hypothetical protein K438DRAFT_1788626 [Mycena galopus ATCC 62051]|nr:hypothetical protein K438DRAFT_1788626 [Mycena galopus ATCC 62051]
MGQWDIPGTILNLHGTSQAKTAQLTTLKNLALWGSDQGSLRWRRMKDDGAGGDAAGRNHYKNAVGGIRVDGWLLDSSRWTFERRLNLGADPHAYSAMYSYSYSPASPRIYGIEGEAAIVNGGMVRRRWRREEKGIFTIIAQVPQKAESETLVHTIGRGKEGKDIVPASCLRSS